MDKYNAGDTVKVTRVGILGDGQFPGLYQIGGGTGKYIPLSGWDVEVIEKAAPKKPKVGDVYGSAREVSISSLHDNAVVIDTDGHPFAVGDDRYMERDNGPYTVVYLPPED